MCRAREPGQHLGIGCYPARGTPCLAPLGGGQTSAQSVNLSHALVSPGVDREGWESHRGSVSGTETSGLRVASLSDGPKTGSNGCPYGS